MSYGSNFTTIVHRLASDRRHEEKGATVNVEEEYRVLSAFFAFAKYTEERMKNYNFSPRIFEKNFI